MEKKKKKEKTPIRPFLAHPAGGQETTFYLRVAQGICSYFSLASCDNGVWMYLHKYLL